MTIQTQLNPYAETIGLLYTCRRPELADRAFLESSAEALGLSGPELYKKFGGLHKKYVAAFQKALPPEVPEWEGFDFFFLSEEDFLLPVQFTCAGHPHWFQEGVQPSREELAQAFLRSVVSDTDLTGTPTLEETVGLLNRADLSTEVCWKMTLLLQDPQAYLAQLVQIVTASLPAYQAAVTAVEKPLGKAMAEFPKGQYTVENLGTEGTVTPLLIFPAAEVIFSHGEEDRGYVGLFVKEIYQMMEQAKQARKNLLPCLKALGDKSKFDILLSLLKSPKYGVELAEALDLSAATVSHHMNVLLSQDLVTVEKREGRVYYLVQKETLRGIVAALEQSFDL